MPDQRFVIAGGQFPGVVHEFETAQRRAGNGGTRGVTAIGNGIGLQQLADDRVETGLTHGTAQHEAVAAHHPDEIVTGKPLIKALRVAEMRPEVQRRRLEAKGPELGQWVVTLGAIEVAG